MSISSLSIAQDWSQVLLNQSWSSVSGLPEEVNWSASVVDSQRNLYITGNSTTSGEGTNLTLTKYDRHGELDWEVEYNNPTDGNDYGAALVIDGAGDIVVVGAAIDDTNGDYDYIILKYSDQGSLIWQKIIDGAAGGNDIAADVDVDAQDNIYVTGGSEGDTTLVDYSTIKLSPDGSKIWESRYNYSNYYDGAVLIDVRQSTLTVTGGSGTDWDSWNFCTVQYDTSGTELYVRRESGAAAGFDQPFDMKSDANGNIYVTGRVASVSEGTNIKTIKLEDDLDLVWSMEFDGDSLNDEGRSLVLDDIGNVYVTGTTNKTGGGSNIVTIKYDSSGNEEWAVQQHTVPTDKEA